MNNDDKNRVLHELVGKCWHEIPKPHWSDEEARCIKCEKRIELECENRGVTDPHPDNPDYFSPDQPHSQVVALVKAAVEKFGARKYLNTLPEPKDSKDETALRHLVTIPAPAIAEAIYELMKDGGEG